MTHLLEAWSRLRALMRRERVDEEFTLELQQHLELLVEEMQRRGIEPERALREARLKLGGLTQLRESHRDDTGWPLLETLLHDFRQAVRGLARSPLVTLVAMVSLALGIGANTAIFSLMGQVFHQLLPVKSPEQLVWLNPRGPAYGNPNGSPVMSYPMFRDLRDRNQVFSSVFGRMLLPAHVGYDRETERAWAEMVSGNFFEGLGVKPHLGRLLTAEDDVTPGAHPVAVLSHRYWQARFDSDPRIVGRKLMINGHPFTIIGVSEPAFQGLDLQVAPQVRVPVMMKHHLTPGWDEMENRRMSWFNVYARLKPGIGMKQAQAALNPLYQSILEQESLAFEDPARRTLFLAGTLDLQSGSQAELSSRKEARPVALLLPGIVAVVLLIACANIANLLLARGAARQKEIAVRLALGASRARLMRQLLAESLLLSLAGGLAGLLVAVWLIRQAMGFVPSDMPAALSPDLDAMVLAFNFAVAVLTGVLFGLLPAWKSTRPEVSPALKDQAGGITGGHRRDTLRKALVIGQVTLSLALLVTAALFARSLGNLRNLHLGFRAGNLIQFSLEPKLNGYSPDRARQFQTWLEERIKELPAVQSVAHGKFAILGGQYWMNRMVTAGEANGHNSYIGVVSPGYFRTVGITLAAGREFTPRDEGEEYTVAVVNESFARRFFGGGNPVGRRIGFARGAYTQTRIEIVGLVEDARYAWLRGEPDAQVYLSSLQDRSPTQMTFYVRTYRSADAISRSIRRLVSYWDPHLPVYGMRSLELQIDERLVLERFLAEFSAGFGMLAAMLAMIGLYGVMAYIVAQRKAEMGIRMALGAGRTRILWLVMREVAALTVAGVAAGLLLSAGIARLLRSLLYGLTPDDPLAMAGATVLILSVAAAAGFTPAWRASRVDPVKALRQE
jgi:predicted permease